MEKKDETAGGEASKRPILFRQVKSLAHHENDAEKKYELCHAYRNQKGKKKSLRDFCFLHGARKSTFSDWLKIYDQDPQGAKDAFRHSAVGRPPILDDFGKMDLKKKVLQLGKDHNHVNFKAFTNLVNEEAEIVANLRGQTRIGKDVSKKTAIRAAKEIGATSRVAQAKTAARISAEKDPRNVITMGVMVDVFCKSLSPSYIYNWDATQYEVDPKGKLKFVVVDDNSVDTPVTVKSEGGLSFFIKHYHLHNADGIVAPPVYVIAYDAMDEENFVPKRVNSMGYNGDDAFICFTKSRAGNNAFFTWYIKEVIIPFITSIRSKIEEKRPALRFKRPFMYCDGEYKQISVIQSPEVLKLLSDAGIDVGKTPASCSGILQASDVSNTFKGIKTRLRNLNDEFGLNELQIQDIKDILATFPEFTAARKKAIVSSLGKVVYCVTNSVKASTVSSGYKRTGQYPVDFKRTLGLTTYKYKPNEVKTIMAALPTLRKEMFETGEIKEETMDNLKIVNVADKTGKYTPNDMRALSNRRALIMNADVCIQKFKEQLEQAALSKNNKSNKKTGQKRKTDAIATSTTLIESETAKRACAQKISQNILSDEFLSQLIPGNSSVSLQNIDSGPSGSNNASSSGSNEQLLSVTGRFTQLQNFFSKK